MPGVLDEDGNMGKDTQGECHVKTVTGVMLL